MPEIVKLSELVLDTDLQSRAEMNMDTVDTYAHDMEEGMADFPPIEVWVVGGKKLLVAGWHRVKAAQKLGIVQLYANMHTGTKQQAILASVKQNHTHGLPRSNKDKRRSIQMLFSSHPDMKDREVARNAGVSHTLVANLRKELSGGVAILPETPAATPPRGGNIAREASSPDSPPPEPARQPARSDGPVADPDDYDHAEPIGPNIPKLKVRLQKEVEVCFRTADDLEAVCGKCDDIAYIKDHLELAHKGVVAFQKVQP